MDALPIDEVLPEVLAALAAEGQAVLQAPPGAGKTTRVPLALLPQVTGRILMLEPRRLAARAAAARMAASLGQAVGETVGYRIRGEAKVSRATRIEVITDGILTRMLQSDPELPGVSAVIFDEFHERALQADLGLALCLQVRAILRPDLAILVMSATLDAGPVAEHLARVTGPAPVVTARGQSFPVELMWRDAPLARDARFESAMAETILTALASHAGGCLAFLPGEGEIRRTLGLLSPRLPPDVRAFPLYGALPFEAQAAALAPLPPGQRRLVLATSIAETSLTIPDIRIVVDGGRARRARFDPGSGMSRLVTTAVTRAEATQRAGRAGRVAPGVCLRMWTKGEEGAQAAFPAPQISEADLAPLALEMALWGEAELPFLTQPPGPALTEARALLADLGALDAQGRITPHGRGLAALPVHPRLGHMLLRAGKSAAPLAALLSDRDPLRGAGVDLSLRLRAVTGRHDGPGSADPGAIARLREETRRLARDLPDRGEAPQGAAAAALAYPDRIAQARPGGQGRFLMSGGKGAVIDPADPLAGQSYLVVTDSDGDPREVRIRLAAAISEADLRRHLGSAITRVETCEWSRREGRVIARRQERLGALTLSDQTWPEVPPEAVAAAMLQGVRELGLRFPPAAERLRARVAHLRAAGEDLPDLSDAALMDRLEEWLAPYLAGVRSAADWARFDPLPALRLCLDRGQMQRLDQLAPPAFVTPLGRAVPIDYGAPAPEIEVKLQEMFGVTSHPKAAGHPLRITLLSPGGKPVQTTQDLPGFWSGAYAEVRRDLRGRYPRHPWPEDPRRAEPTQRAKPRGT